ncbi:hypothetical protein MMC14_004474 [Varicellaria rhodocarpa]|nr:hypothetical protein [Varicellaria rhodocarpa]
MDGRLCEDSQLYPTTETLVQPQHGESEEERESRRRLRLHAEDIERVREEEDRRRLFVWALGPGAGVLARWLDINLMQREVGVIPAPVRATVPRRQKTGQPCRSPI